MRHLPVYLSTCPTSQDYPTLNIYPLQPGNTTDQKIAFNFFKLFPIEDSRKLTKNTFSPLSLYVLESRWIFPWICTMNPAHAWLLVEHFLNSEHTHILVCLLYLDVSSAHLQPIWHQYFFFNLKKSQILLSISRLNCQNYINFNKLSH